MFKLELRLCLQLKHFVCNRWQLRPAFSGFIRSELFNIDQLVFKLDKILVSMQNKTS